MSRLQVGGLALLIKANNPENLGAIVEVISFNDFGMVEIKPSGLDLSKAHLSDFKRHFFKRWVCPPSWLMPLGDKQTQDELAKEKEHEPV